MWLFKSRLGLFWRLFTICVINSACLEGLLKMVFEIILCGFISLGSLFIFLEIVLLLMFFQASEVIFKLVFILNQVPYHYVYLYSSFYY